MLRCAVLARKLPNLVSLIAFDLWKCVPVKALKRKLLPHKLLAQLPKPLRLLAVFREGSHICFLTVLHIGAIYAG